MAKIGITRHEFLRIAGLAAGGAVLGACAPQQAVKETQIVQPTNTKPPTLQAVKETQIVQPTNTMPPTLQAVKETKIVKPTNTKPPVLPRADLYMTEQRTISSSLLKRDYQLAVQVPEQYASFTSSTYPVLYVLDGDIFFGMAANLAPILGMTDGLPEMIIVGITYPMQSYEQFFTLRELDYKIPGAGGAPANSRADIFLAVLKQEFIPFIEKNYRVKSDQRALYGYSSSGFFVLYALFQEPGLFRYYLSGSGDLDSSTPYVLAHNQKLATREKNDPINVYLSVGELEDGSSGSSVASFNQLVEAMNPTSYPGVQLTKDIYAGEHHGGGGAALTYFKGLRKLLTS